MLKMTRWAVCMWLMVAGIPRAAVAASITLASGEVVEGTIQGRVLIARSSPDGQPAFRIVEGKDIVSIDARGIHTEGESVLFVSMKGASIDDTLQGLIWWDEGRALKLNKGLVRDVGKAQVIGVRMPTANIKPAPEHIVGGYTINPSRKRIDVVESLRLQRPDGEIRTIPVSEITKFQQ